MIEPDKRKAIHLLSQEAMGTREIARRLGLGRNTVREIIRQGGAVPASTRAEKIQIDPELLRRLHVKCDGWKQRIYEKLVEEEGVKVTYSTLTRKLRELGLGLREKARCRRPALPVECRGGARDNHLLERPRGSQTTRYIRARVGPDVGTACGAPDKF